ncbi:MAG: response regulator transcription factor [Rhodanobacter sp.]
MKILIVEDDRTTAAHIAEGVQNATCAADIAVDGLEGLSMAMHGHYDLLIVDRMLPRLDGISLLRELRERGREMPVMMVSALGEIDQRVEGLQAGVDDYLCKPFALVELKARVAALARRPRLGESTTRLCVGDLELDRISREVRRGGMLIELQPREFRLLEFLMSNADRVVTRTMLLESVWEFHFDPQTSVVETHISRLRGKIDRGFGGDMLRTVRGAGYCLHAAA